jgi:hypothetical protein
MSTAMVGQNENSKKIFTTKIEDISLDELWNSAPTNEQVLGSESFADLPSLARLYLEHAIAPGAKVASAVRLWMHGEIKLGQRWYAFKGEEVIRWNRGMIWRATTWMRGLPIWGADRLVDGLSAVQWKMLGLFPVMSASGPDVTKSGIGRLQGESVWLPSVLCGPDVSWTELDATNIQANFTVLGEWAELILTVDRSGRLERIKFQRWGNPEGVEHHYADFGGLAEEEATFGDYTIPTSLRLGWFFGSNCFESKGEFFRCTVDNAIYR